jgi:hypothetical protein
MYKLKKKKKKSWTMPEEYRIWKEKIEAIEKKKLTSKSENQAKPNSNSSNNNSVNVNKVSTTTVDTTIVRPTKASRIQEEASAPSIVYASSADAMDAFKDLLLARKVPVTAKMKEVQDICQDDPRWDALRTIGDRKQALAEYQVNFIIK